MGGTGIFLTLAANIAMLDTGVFPTNDALDGMFGTGYALADSANIGQFFIDQVAGDVALPGTGPANRPGTHGTGMGMVRTDYMPVGAISQTGWT
jgi:hypothetical protein